MCSQETCYWNFGADCLTSPPTVTGNLAWAMQLWHYVYLYTQDEQALRDLYPLLRRTVSMLPPVLLSLLPSDSVAEQVNFYQHLQVKNATDGRIHLPPTFSPEYAVAPDCNYDNALYRYALSALVDAIDTLGLSDPLAAQYRLSLEKLSPSPVAP